jgi:hypothetical protein
MPALRGGRRWRRAVMVLAAVLALAVVALAWRLRRGPIALPFLSRPIAGAISQLVPDAVVEVGGTDFVWSERGPVLRALDLEIRRADGTRIAFLPRLGVRPSFRALLHGELAIAAIRITGARLALVRLPNGEITAGSAGTGVLGSLVGGPAPRSALSYIGLADAWVEVDDRAAGLVWKAEGTQVRVRIHRTETIAQIETRLVVESPGSGVLRHLELPISATAHVGRDAAGEPSGAAIEARSEEGRVLFAGERTTLPLASALLRANVSSDAKTVDVEAFQATVGPAKLNSTARWSIDSDALQIRGHLGALRVADLSRVWPDRIATRTRNWIVHNLRDGEVTGSDFSLHLSGRAAAGTPATNELEFGFAGLTIDYLHPLEPVREARGSAKLTATGFEATVEEATAGELSIRHGRFAADLRKPDVPGNVEVDASGPTKALLELLESPPLGIPSRIGLPIDRASGSSAVHAEFRFPLSNTTASAVKVAATADLHDTSLPEVVDDIGVEKGDFQVRVEGDRVAVEGDTGLSGTQFLPEPIHVSLTYEPEEIGNVLQATFTGRDLAGEAKAAFDGGILQRLTVARLRYGSSDLSGRLARGGDGRFRISAVGPRLDLRPFLRGFDPRTALEEPPLGAGWDLEAHLGRVLVGPDLELIDVNARAAGEGKHVRSMTVSGESGRSGDFRLDLEPGGRRLSLSSERAGELLKALGLYDHASGGRLSLTTAVTGGGLDGELDLRDFRITQAPILARVLSVGSFSGIADLLRGEGLAFSRAHMDFSWSEDRLEVQHGTAVGAIGITTDGTIDRRAERVDLRGSLIPAYTLNSVLGKLPLFGKFLVGGEGQGVFGIEYRVGGTPDNPEVTVNPLSALAPGALRTMFVDPFTNKSPPPKKPTSAGP